MKKRLLILAVLAAIGILALSSVSMAATKTGSVSVTANVAANCSVSNIVNVTWPTGYDTTDPAPLNTGTGSFDLRCTKGVDYWVYIPDPWTMSGGPGPENLTFQLYSSGYATLWDKVKTGAATHSNSNAAVPKTVNAGIDALQDVAAGAYTVNVLATIEY